MGLKLYYVVQGLHSWKDWEVDTNGGVKPNFPIKISCFSSVGFLPVYEDLAQLKKDFPNRNYSTIKQIDESEVKQ